MARYFWNSKTEMWTQTYQLQLKNFLSRKVFQKISKSKKTVWLIELSLCSLENQNSTKNLQQSLVQKNNEYKLAYISTVYLNFKKSWQLFKRLIVIFNCRLKPSSDIGTIYFKKSCQLFKRLIAILNCRLKPSSDIGTVYLNFKKSCQLFKRLIAIFNSRLKPPSDISTLLFKII